MPDDHMALELDFLSKTGKRIVADIEDESDGGTTDAIKALSDVECYLKNHMLKWFPSLLEKTDDNPKASFYQKAVSLCVECVIVDYRDIRSSRERLAESSEEQYFVDSL